MTTTLTGDWNTEEEAKECTRLVRALFFDNRDLIKAAVEQWHIFHSAIVRARQWWNVELDTDYILPILRSIDCMVREGRGEPTLEHFFDVFADPIQGCVYFPEPLDRNGTLPLAEASVMVCVKTTYGVNNDEVTHQTTFCIPAFLFTAKQEIWPSKHTNTCRSLGTRLFILAQFVHQTCDKCSKWNAVCVRCPTCKCRSYCDDACRKRDLAFHASRCKPLANAHVEYLRCFEECDKNHF